MEKEGEKTLGLSNFAQKVKLLNLALITIDLPLLQQHNCLQAHTTEKWLPEKFTEKIFLALPSPASQPHTTLCDQSITKSLPD